MNLIAMVLKNLNFGTSLPILISLVSLIYTIRHNYKLSLLTEKNENWRNDFEFYKENNRQKDMSTSIKTSIFPCFNIVLDNNGIKKSRNFFILEVGFINIGKESATNIQLVHTEDDKKNGTFLNDYYLSSEGYKKNTYYIYTYLSKYYAMVKEKVTFKIKLDLHGSNTINDFLKFKIKYNDLIGNIYYQEFRFGIYMTNNSLVYNLDNTSYSPIAIDK